MKKKKISEVKTHHTDITQGIAPVLNEQSEIANEQNDLANNKNNEKEIIIKKDISPELYSEIEKKLIEYFNARPIND